MNYPKTISLNDNVYSLSQIREAVQKAIESGKTVSPDFAMALIKDIMQKTSGSTKEDEVVPLDKIKDTIAELERLIEVDTRALCEGIGGLPDHALPAYNHAVGMAETCLSISTGLSMEAHEAQVIKSDFQYMTFLIVGLNLLILERKYEEQAIEEESIPGDVSDVVLVKSTDLVTASEIKKHFITMDESHQLNTYVGQDTYGNYANNVQNALLVKLANAGLINFDIPEPEMKA